ncbi:cytochrome c-type biogenesis CcmH-like mitochondrial protein [Salvia splendens]|uniref:cytochrome c-type biogenesis CcmH-like mitochondrial protein n=1 Tax=Salvia splendens TaxID=180675 RepID=UPI001C266D30|nr:cytochrome c-type biogenesis CcmH-like mitochondrial protein [Salvia splendens]
MGVGKNVHIEALVHRISRARAIYTMWRQLIRDEIRSGKNDKEIYKKLEEDFGETVLYTSKFDIQTMAIWLAPLTLTGGAVLIWALKRYRRKNNVHIMGLDLVRGVPLTPKEKEAMPELLTPPSTRWWGKWLPR